MFMDLKTMLIQWALMFITQATDGKTHIDCTLNKQMMARGVTAITCSVALSKGDLAVGVTFAPHDAQLD
jgi:hypothetical protein